MADSQQYDFSSLAKIHLDLKKYVKLAPAGHQTIDFADVEAVKALNIALLMQECGLDYYDIPDGFLVPAVPGRWKYIDALNQLFLKEGARRKTSMQILDLGVGANAVYSLLAHKKLDWRAVGSDIHKESIAHAQSILDKNNITAEQIKLLHQDRNDQILHGILTEDDYYDAVLFNPPFYETEEAQEANVTKAKNLGIEQTRNFAGRLHEIACHGGELRIVSDYIKESKQYAYQVYCYSCLISQGKHLDALIKLLEQLEAVRYDTIDLDTKNKKARILFWSFLSKKQATAWQNYRWK